LSLSQKEATSQAKKVDLEAKLKTKQTQLEQVKSEKSTHNKATPERPNRKRAHEVIDISSDSEESEGKFYKTLKIAENRQLKLQIPKKLTKKNSQRRVNASKYDLLMNKRWTRPNWPKKCALLWTNTTSPRRTS
jgi:hypothetical protein